MNVKVDQVLDGEYTWLPSEEDQEPYVFEGERFWDAIQDEMEYWSIAYDEMTEKMYYFEYTTGKTQWEPPKQVVYKDSTHVLLWDANEQWFYIYDTINHTSQWLEHYDGNIMLESHALNEDCWSQATTEELEIDCNEERRFYVRKSYQKKWNPIVL
ncbi:hypothetical protein THRCLA_06894 [Thraustotheca clavata]|uniref:WW domain-containing protein n=1 Tax=Thraustotheca clavata TaxID=74557 RepID=A0A1V9ZI34_9STRA|nr:hypothetical protein THRCLA_06894 [Thraustotheca clavata]